VRSVAGAARYPGHRAACARGGAGRRRAAGRRARRRSSPATTGPASFGGGRTCSRSPLFPCVLVCVLAACVPRAAAQPPPHPVQRPAPRHGCRAVRTSFPAARGRRSGTASAPPWLRCRSVAFRWNRPRLCLFAMFRMFLVFRPVFARDSPEHLPERLVFHVFHRRVPAWREDHQAPSPTPCSASARTG